MPKKMSIRKLYFSVRYIILNHHHFHFPSSRRPDSASATIIIHISLLCDMSLIVFVCTSAPKLPTRTPASMYIVMVPPHLPVVRKINQKTFTRAVVIMQCSSEKLHRLVELVDVYLLQSLDYLMLNEMYTYIIYIIKDTIIRFQIILYFIF